MSDTGPLEGLPGGDGRPARVLAVDADGTAATVEADGVVRRVSVATWAGVAPLRVGDWVMATDVAVVRRTDLDEVAWWRTQHRSTAPDHPDIGLAIEPDVAPGRPGSGTDPT